MWRYAAAFAATLSLAVILVHTAVNRAEITRLRALRAEHHRLESELQKVKASVDEVRPVLVLENGDTRLLVNVADTGPSTTQQPITY